MSMPAPIHFKDDTETWELQLKCLTPLFGGGVASHTNGLSHMKPADDHTLVRGSAIRGSLRFWWRATSGVKCATIEEMREKEGRIFGAVVGKDPQPSAVSISVDCRSLTRRDAKIDPRSEGGLAYGAFPLSPPGSRNDPWGPLNEVSGNFGLTLRFPKEYAEELTLALSAFMHFGGIGGRTTRGFGQLTEVEASGHILSVSELLNALPDEENSPLRDRVPAIEAASYLFVSDNYDDKLNSALNHLRVFRQGPTVGRREGQQRNRPGRSYWPEPDEIRRLTRRSDKLHETSVTSAHAFPRAVFGLPIIFHYQTKADPEDTTLYPTDAQGKALERMRSPLQISIHPDGYSYLLLSAPRPEQLVLKGQRSQEWSVRATLKPDELDELRSKSRRLFTTPDNSENYNALNAFLAFVSAETNASLRGSE